jgi:hypothetical protein
MAYRKVLIYNEAGDFLGAGIKADEAIKLQTTNLYAEGEEAALAIQLGRLNESAQIKGAWPDTRDPDVQALLYDTEFMPVEMSEQQVMDEDNSFLVWKQVPILDDDGMPVQPLQLTDSDEIDWDASAITYKTILAPVRPSDVGERIRHAQETVARQRSGNA